MRYLSASAAVEHALRRIAMSPFVRRRGPRMQGMNEDASTGAARQALVEMRGVGVARGGRRWLMRGIDMELKRGEIVTLIGPNGSGKSTTAKTAIGIMKPSEGNGGARRAPARRLRAAKAQRRLDAAAFRRAADDTDHGGAAGRCGGCARSRGDRPSRPCRSAPSVGRRIPARASGAGRCCGSPISWCSTSRCRASTFPARSRFTT